MTNFESLKYAEELIKNSKYSRETKDFLLRVLKAEYYNRDRGVPKEDYYRAMDAAINLHPKSG